MFILSKLWLSLLLEKKKSQVYYTVDNPTKNWKGGKGYISKDMALKGLPGPGEDTLILESITFKRCPIDLFSRIFICRVISWFLFSCLFLPSVSNIIKMIEFLV